MKTRTVSVKASDSDVSIEVITNITQRKGTPLTEEEMDAMAKKSARLIASMLSELPYADFGAENTRIVM